MNTIATRTIQGVTLLAVFTMLSASETAVAQSAPQFFQGDDGSLHKLVLNGRHLRGSLENNPNGTSIFHAELKVCTVQQPNGTIVEKEVFIGQFFSTLKDGRQLSGTLEIWPTATLGVVEVRSFYRSLENQEVTASSILTELPSTLGSRLRPVSDASPPARKAESRSVTVDYDQFQLLPMAELKDLGL